MTILLFLLQIMSVFLYSLFLTLLFSFGSFVPNFFNPLIFSSFYRLQHDLHDFRVLHAIQRCVFVNEVRYRLLIGANEAGSFRTEVGHKFSKISCTSCKISEKNVYTEVVREEKTHDDKVSSSPSLHFPKSLMSCSFEGGHWMLRNTNSRELCSKNNWPLWIHCSNITSHDSCNLCPVGSLILRVNSSTLTSMSLKMSTLFKNNADLSMRNFRSNSVNERHRKRQMRTRPNKKSWFPTSLFASFFVPQPSYLISSTFVKKPALQQVLDVTTCKWYCWWKKSCTTWEV